MRNVLILLFGLILPVYTTGASEDNTGLNDSASSGDSNSSMQDQYIKQYLDQINEQEKLHGAMDAQLGEQLLGLGLLYKNHGMYDEAGEVLNRSLQIKRVNDGIQNMDQVPILKALIEVNSAAKQWDELDRNYHLLLWVYERNLEPGDPELLPIIDLVGRWKMAAYSGGLLSEKASTTLYDLIDMYQSHVNLMTKLYGEDDPRLLGPLKGLAIARYQLVSQISSTPVDEFEGFERRTRLETQCVRMMDPSGRLITVCRPVEVPNTGYYVSKQNTKNQRVSEQMVSIRNSLNRIVKISSTHPSLSTYDRANALINLGDWYLINNERSTAFENYKQAYQMLSAEDDDSEAIEKLFGEPVRIPFADIFASDGNNETTRKVVKPYVILSFAVTLDGKARQIKVIEQSEPKSFKIRKAATDNIKASLFRPRLEDGKPVATPKIELVLSGRDLQTVPGQFIDSHSSIYNGTSNPY